MKHTFFLAVLFTLFLTSAVALAQPSEEIEIDYLSNKEPVKIVSVKVGETSVESGKKFPASEDWLKDLTVTVKNYYRKTVSYVEIGIIVFSPEGQEHILPYGYRFWLGNRRTNLDKSVLKLEAGSKNDNAELSLPSTEYASIRESLDWVGHPTKIKRIRVQVEEVTFADGTVWSLGGWYRIDLTDPRNLIPTPKN
jgi:hypothetical protein